MWLGNWLSKGQLSEGQGVKYVAVIYADGWFVGGGV